MSDVFESYQNLKNALSLYRICNYARNLFNPYQNHKKVLTLYQICDQLLNAFKPYQNYKNALCLYRICNHAFHLNYRCLQDSKRKREKKHTIEEERQLYSLRFWNTPLHICSSSRHWLISFSRDVA